MSRPLRPSPSLAAAALLGLAPAGCVLLPTLGGRPPVADEARIPPPSRSGLLDLRGIIHCHSLQSHDSDGTFEEIAAAAREVGASFVVLTDHLEELTQEPGPDGFVDGVLFIPGIEKKSGFGARLLVLGVRAGIHPHASDPDTLATVHARGGVVAVGHPERVDERGVPPADGVELMNLHADTVDEFYPWLGVRALFLPPGAFYGTVINRQAKAAEVYDALAHDRPVAAIGACDAHEAVSLLGPLGATVDTYPRVFRAANTHVLAAGLSREEILAALRAGRSYAACELEHDATGFRFVARRGAEVVAVLGGEAPAGPDVVLEVQASVPCTLTLYRDGAPIRTVEGPALVLEAPPEGAYRVEAQLGGIPWVATSAIRIRPGE